MIYAINYADKKFEYHRKYNTKTAYSKGKVDKVLEYSIFDIDEEFKTKNEKILQYRRGAGLWLWKPYIIKKTLEKMSSDDYLFYSDSGSFFINKVQYLIDVLEQEKESILLFGLPLYERQFTKKETFVLMNYLSFEENQILGSFLLLKKTPFSVSFVDEWLSTMTDERILSPTHFLPDVVEFEDFISHREDQSILSILAHKKNMSIYRDPSEYGVFPWLYKLNDNVKYVPQTYINSNYPIILMSCRQENPYLHKIKVYIKLILYKLGLYKK